MTVSAYQPLVIKWTCLTSFYFNYRILTTRNIFHFRLPSIYAPLGASFMHLYLLVPMCTFHLSLSFFLSSLVSCAKLPDWAVFKVFLTIFLTSVAQILGNFLGHFQIWHFLSKNCWGEVLGNFWKNLVPFYSNIWSHWWCVVCRLLTFHLNILCKLIRPPQTNSPQGPSPPQF